MVKKLDRQDTIADGTEQLGEPGTDTMSHLQAIMTAGRRIHEAVDVIDQIISARLGLHRNDLRCLHLLEAGPATPGEVAAHTGLTSGSVTALIDRLEVAGFVDRCRSTADRRSVAVAMTEARVAELRALYAEIEPVIAEHFGGMEPAVIAETGTALGRFADALDVFAQRHGGGRKRADVGS